MKVDIKTLFSKQQLEEIGEESKKITQELLKKTCENYVQLHFQNKFRKGFMEVRGYDLAEMKIRCDRLAKERISLENQKIVMEMFKRK